MFSSAHNSPTNRDSQQDFWQGSWPSIVRIIILEIVVLLALAGAFVYYLNWSSEAAVSEFMSDGSHSLQAVKDRPSCGRSV